MSEYNIEEIIDGDLQRQELITLAEKKAAQVIKILKARSLKLALAESCTAGLISSMLANVPGASSVLWGSFVCYAKEAKISMLSIGKKEIEKYGLVSREIACKMAEGAHQKSGADLAVSVTGLAGPSGDGSAVPVGTVWIASAAPQMTTPVKYHFTGDRNIVRLRAAIAVMKMILKIIKEF